MEHPQSNPPVLSERAPAKINLDLRVTGRRADGYHLLDSLVVFADCGDVLEYFPDEKSGLEITGPFSRGLEADEGNLVFKAVRAFSAQAGVDVPGRFVLTKNLPVASGLGGGSADAAAALRLLDRLHPGLVSARELEEVALTLGADVPACLWRKSLRMQAIGEVLSPVVLDFPLYILLANPGITVETAGIFRALRETGFGFSPERQLPERIASLTELLGVLEGSRNDLEPPACDLVAGIAELLDRLESLEGCRYAAMSGSGATCFGLFETREEMEVARRNLSMDSKNYWIEIAGVL